MGCTYQSTKVEKSVASFNDQREYYIYISKFYTQNKSFSPISNDFKIHFQPNIIIKIQMKMQETIHLSDLWEHTITKIFKLDPKYKVDHMIRQWEIYNKLEDFNSLLNYTNEDFKPHGGGSLSYYKENGDSVVKKMSTTPLQQLENLRWYIQHLIHESGYLYDDDESNYPPSEDKWMLQTHGNFMKYVLFTLHRMTPEQMKMNPIKPITKVKTNEELDKEEAKSIKDEEESSETSQELSEEQNAPSDIYTEAQEDSQSIEASQVHNVFEQIHTK